MAKRSLPTWWDHDDNSGNIQEAKRKLLPLVRAAWPRLQEFLWAEEQFVLAKLRGVDPNDAAATAKLQGILTHIERMLKLADDIRDLQEKDDKNESVQSH